MDRSKSTSVLLDVLMRVVEDGPVSVVDVASPAHLRWRGAQEMLDALHRRRFVIKAGERYVAGPALIELAQVAEPLMWDAARRAMDGVARQTGETVVLQAHRSGMTVIEEQVVATTHLVRVRQVIGARHRLEDTASGRVLRAFAGRDGGGGAEIRQRGYATTSNGGEQGADALAVPVRGQRTVVQWCLALLVPAPRSRRLLDHLGALTHAADDIAKVLEL